MLQVVISGELNYSDPMIQAQVENLTQTFENTTYISSPLYTESWLRSFVGYIHRNQEYLNVSIDTEESFIKILKEVRHNSGYSSIWWHEEIDNNIPVCASKLRHGILQKIF
jgi:hypothetical protein